MLSNIREHPIICVLQKTHLKYSTHRYWKNRIQPAVHYISFIVYWGYYRGCSCDSMVFIEEHSLNKILNIRHTRWLMTYFLSMADHNDRSGEHYGYIWDTLWTMTWHQPAVTTDWRRFEPCPVRTQMLLCLYTSLPLVPAFYPPCLPIKEWNIHHVHNSMSVS